MRSQALRVLMVLAAGLGGCAHQPLPEACYDKPASGRCQASHKRFYFDPDARACKPFIWGGCNGRVPFESREQCRRTCEPAAPENAPAPKARSTEE